MAGKIRSEASSSSSRTSDANTTDEDNNNSNNNGGGGGGGLGSESLVLDCGRNRSSCGYCRSPGRTSISHGSSLNRLRNRFAIFSLWFFVFVIGLIGVGWFDRLLEFFLLIGIEVWTIKLIIISVDLLFYLIVFGYLVNDVFEGNSEKFA